MREKVNKFKKGENKPQRQKSFRILQRHPKDMGKKRKKESNKQEDDEQGSSR